MNKIIAKYTHYQDYYKKYFEPKYAEVVELLEQYNTTEFVKKREFCELKELLSKGFKQLFHKSCNLMQYYLNNNGIFQFSEIDVIRAAFYAEIITEGDMWMELYATVRNRGRDIDFVIETFIRNFKAIQDVNVRFSGIQDSPLTSSYLSGLEQNSQAEKVPKCGNSKRTRWSESRKIFNNHYEHYLQLRDLYNSNTYEQYRDYRAFFDEIKFLYVFYIKTLRYIFLEDYNYKEFIPRKILSMAASDDYKLINDAELWYDFIDDVNELCQTIEIKKIIDLTKEIVEKYKDAPETAYVNLNSYRQNEDFQESYENEINPDKLTKPNYKSSDIGISEKSYNILLKYLRQNKELRYLWLHGSRAKGTALKNSDIDCISDIPFEKHNVFLQGLKNLQIPYNVDCVNINTTNEFEQNFLKKIASDAKLIYRAEDFS